MPRNYVIADDIVKYLRAHTHQPVHVEEIMEATEATRATVQRTVARLADDLPIKVLVAGNTWIYQPPVPDAPVVSSAPVTVKPMKVVRPKEELAAGDVLEVVGVTPSGAVLRDNAGTLYRATKMS